jgi:hypothetical protein
MNQRGDHHEFRGPHAVIAASSDRSFGLVFAGFFVLLAGVNFWGAGRWWPYYAAIAAGFLVLAWLRPGVLAPLNRLWAKFGVLLGRIVAPIVLGLLFYLVMTPIGLVIRALGRDPLRLRRDPTASSYWIVREPPGPAPETMREQF